MILNGCNRIECSSVNSCCSLDSRWEGRWGGDGEGGKGEGRDLSLCIGRERARERIRYDSNAYETGLYFELSPWGVPRRRAGKVKKSSET